jgi:DNA (cytosine-5)-methyltransferase 1
MNVLDLFSGVGGFSLGLERAGMQTVAFCEINPYCRRVLAQHWPHVRCYKDIRKLSGEQLRADGVAADIACGGFPCQEISDAGNREGMRGARSRLWSEFARILGELRPRYALVENVSALLDRGLGDVLGDLAALGYDCEWHSIPACAIGAPHERDRIWIIARLADTANAGLQIGSRLETDDAQRRVDALRGRLILAPRWFEARRAVAERQGWNVEPAVGRVAHGIPARVDRIKALGNAVIPQVVEIIGQTIMFREKQCTTH